MRTSRTVLGMLGVCAIVLMATTGCSVFMAAKQPDAKDLSVLNPGTPRQMLLAELGAPVWSGEREGSKVEVYSFVDGYSRAAKAARAFFHGAADVFTLGLWEVIGTPAEAIFSGKKMTVEVVYDDVDRVRTSRVIESPADASPAAATAATRP